MDHISETLEALSDGATAKRLGRQFSSLRGVRGVPMGEVARIAAAAYNRSRPRLSRDEDALGALFSTAWEDGLVAVGLLAVCACDDPLDAMEIALEWTERIDDIATADSVGQLVLAPAVVLADQQPRVVSALLNKRRPEARRVLAAMGLGWTTALVQGPAAAPMRAQVKQRRLRMVDRALSDRIHHVCDAVVHDEAATVRKALRRLLRAWTEDDAAAVVAWGDTQRGGLPKMLGAEVARARRAGGT